MSDSANEENTITLTSEIAVRLVDKMGGDHSVVAAAKVSTSGMEALSYADPKHAESNIGLIGYLMKMRHGTPFEHSSLSFFVNAPIFVWREWHRHRIGFAYSEYGLDDQGMGQSFNEESGRYKELDPVFWVPRRDRAMVPVEGWKSGRPKFLTLDQKADQHNAKLDAGAQARGCSCYDPDCYSDPDSMYSREINRKRSAYQAAYDAYRESIEDGIAFEVARSVLPVGIYSSCWVTTNPRALMSFLSLRTHEPDSKYPSYPQAEIEEAARVAETFLAQGWPITHAAFCKHGRVAP